MRQALGWIAVGGLLWAASAAAGEAPPDAREWELQAAFDKVLSLSNEGKYAEAVTQGERVIVLLEALSGGTHPEIARWLELLGRWHWLLGKPDQAESLLQRALAVHEAAVGKSHPDVVRALNSLALLYNAQGLYGRAVPLLERVLAIQEATLGKSHSDVAQSLNNLANLYQEQGLYNRAEPLRLRTLAISEAALGKHHPQVAISLNNLAVLYQKQGLYSRAEPLLERALAIEKAALGSTHPTIARTLTILALVYQEQGLYGRAEPLYQRARAIQETALGKHHPDVARTLNSLATLYVAQGLYGRAEPLHQRALAINEAAFGKDHPAVADSLTHLALLYHVQGLYGRAEPLNQRAFAISEGALGKNHPAVAQTLTNVALLYQAQGLYAQAELLHQRALAIQEGALGKNHPEVAQSLNNLATTYWAQGLHSQAEPLYQRALAISEATLGKNHSTFATYLTNLGGLYFEEELYDRAEPLIKRALAIREATLGKHHPDFAHSLHSLAVFYRAQGLYGRAEPLLERALAIQELALGQSHPLVALLLNELALLQLSQQRPAAAVELFTRAFAMSEQRLRQEALDFSEARLSSFLQLLRADEERLYALVRAQPDNASVRRLALSAALLLKGRSVEETAGISRSIYQSLGAEEHGAFKRLRERRTQLAKLSLEGSGSLPPKAYQQQLRVLTAQGGALEAALAKRSAPLRALTALPTPAHIVDRVAASLPKDGALVEFITYLDKPLMPEPGWPVVWRPSQLRYLALVLLPDATIRVQDLGPAEPIDVAASRLRNALANRDAAFQARAEALYQQAFQPLLPLVGKTRRLFLSPDGQLALVPFAALHDGQQFLVESFNFTYLTSGKDLLPRAQKISPAGSVVVLADPDFTASLPLPGTRKEAEAIKRLFPRAQLFLGPEATKERLLHLPAPGILHLATHGVFLDDVPASAPARAVGQIGELGEDTAAPRLPSSSLLRSGLLFSSARARTPPTLGAPQPPPDSALVTALELAGLNLWGTQLVVLSACDTGRGDVKLGQGVYGLRRAFMVAGAETVVMSLWKVNDETTRTLMEAYYTQLLAGQGRASALREAMRSLRATQPHPYYWAPFIALGRDAPLRALKRN